ncbi:GPO family capsid scaffolding protein [Utexia brackfieldae]|uniref:GPO family capsid scaffolding protein n=1 Tax=Utexia brackfieldae TaxID=3074108 RepID=UPI00370D2E26
MSKATSYKAKWFRVAVEGATTDGRKIQRDWILQMAENYSPEVYGARINIEHIKGYGPEGTFKRYGDVLALKSIEITEGKLAGKLALLALIEPTEDLIKLNKSKQKVYTSIEVNPEFADTGEAYLVGLAVTDDPASLGTEFLEFSAKATFNPLSSRKLSPNNLFTAAEETVIEFETDEKSNDALFSSMVNRLTNLFQNKSDKDATKFAQLGDIVEQFFNQTISQFSELNSKVTELTDELVQIKAQNDEYRALLGSIPDTPDRPVSSGGNLEANTETDC